MMNENFKHLLDKLEASEDNVTGCVSDMRDAMEDYIDRLDALLQPFYTMPAEALNTLITWGFVPGAKVHYDNLKDDLVFVGYTELMRMKFRKPNGEDVSASIEATTKNLEHFTLVCQGAEIPAPAPEKTGLEA